MARLFKSAPLASTQFALWAAVLADLVVPIQVFERYCLGRYGWQ